MGLKIETWNIAYRKKAMKTFRDTNEPFTVIPNGYKGWYADPFLFDYQGISYLFAEFFSYRLGRGVISVAKYDSTRGRFGDFTEIISEEYHLSYPVVFTYNSQIYMMPECAESRGLYFYRAIKFPFEWEKISVLDDKMKLADTTPFKIGKDLFALSLMQDENSANGELILLKYDGRVFKKLRNISNDMSSARPGGNVIFEREKMLRVAQDSEQDYGKALNIIEVQNLTDDYSEKTVFCMTPDLVSPKNGKSACGIHTYNSSKNFEVIDLKYYRNSWYRLFLKILHKG